MIAEIETYTQKSQTAISQIANQRRRELEDVLVIRRGEAQEV